MSLASGRPLALALVALAALPAFAQQRWDHRGALGLTVAGGVGVGNAAGGGLSDSGARGLVDVGASLGITEKSELRLTGRLGLGGPTVGVAAFFGLRNAYGERFKTFFDLELAVHLVPVWTVGPRVGFGVQYELSPVVGAFASLAGQFGFGGGIRLEGEVLVGLQLRTYLFD